MMRTEELPSSSRTAVMRLIMPLDYLIIARRHLIILKLFWLTAGPASAAGHRISFFGTDIPYHYPIVPSLCSFSLFPAVYNSCISHPSSSF